MNQKDEITKLKNIRIREDVWQKFKAVCALENKTLGDTIADLMMGYTDKSKTRSNFGINSSSAFTSTPKSKLGRAEQPSGNDDDVGVEYKKGEKKWMK